MLAALRARDQGKCRGQIVDLSLFEPLFSILGPMATAYAIDGSVPKRSGNWGDVAAPRNVYACADGAFVAMSATMQSMWEKLAAAIGRPELVDDPRFLTNPDRVENRAELEAIVSDFSLKELARKTSPTSKSAVSPLDRYATSRISSSIPTFRAAGLWRPIVIPITARCPCTPRFPGCRKRRPMCARRRPRWDSTATTFCRKSD